MFPPPCLVSPPRKQGCAPVRAGFPAPEFLSRSRTDLVAAPEEKILPEPEGNREPQQYRTEIAIRAPVRANRPADNQRRCRKEWPDRKSRRYGRAYSQEKGRQQKWVRWSRRWPRRRPPGCGGAAILRRCG